MTQDAQDFSDYSDTVLYDVFYEAGTQLGGWLIAAAEKAEAKGDAEQAQAHLTRLTQLQGEREAVDGRDRDAQAAAICRWRDEKQGLDVHVFGTDAS